MIRKCAIFLAAISLTACSIGDDVPKAETAMTTFHKMLNDGQFDAIYVDASQDMKNATTQLAFVRLLSAVHRKLGAFKSGKVGGWNDNTTTNGHFISLNYIANYEHGAATESFVYRIADNRASLAGYNVNSEALILN